jgi:hypothetical protein
MEGYDRAAQLCTALDSQQMIDRVFPRFADERRGHPNPLGQECGT